MKRKIIFSDIHGFYYEFIALLNKINYDPQHDQLILLGDYINKGKESLKVIQKIMNMISYDTVFLKGNHEIYMEQFLHQNNLDFDKEFLKERGGLSFLKSFCGTYSRKFSLGLYKDMVKSNFHDEITFLTQLPLFYEDDKHIYVHSGFDASLEDWKESSEEKFLFNREFSKTNVSNTNKTVIFGHTPTRFISGNNQNDIWFSKDRKKIAIDGGIASGGQLNCLEIIGDKYITHHQKPLKKRTRV